MVKRLVLLAFGEAVDAYVHVEVRCVGQLQAELAVVVGEAPLVVRCEVIFDKERGHGERDVSVAEHAAGAVLDGPVEVALVVELVAGDGVDFHGAVAKVEARVAASEIDVVGVRGVHFEVDVLVSGFHGSEGIVAVGIDHAVHARAAFARLHFHVKFEAFHEVEGREEVIAHASRTERNPGFLCLVGLHLHGRQGLLLCGEEVLSRVSAADRLCIDPLAERTHYQKGQAFE